MSSEKSIKEYSKNIKEYGKNIKNYKNLFILMCMFLIENDYDEKNLLYQKCLYYVLTYIILFNIFPTLIFMLDSNDTLINTYFEKYTQRSNLNNIRELFLYVLSRDFDEDRYEQDITNYLPLLFDSSIDYGCLKDLFIALLGFIQIL